MLTRDQQLAISLGSLLSLIRESRGLTRSDLADLTGLARSTVTARLSELVALGLVVEIPGEQSTGGRPPAVFAFNVGAGVVLAVDAGASRIALAIADMSGDVLVERSELRGIDAGPQDTLRWVCAELDAMLADAKRSRDDVRGVGVGLPGSVDFATGRPVSPYLMPGWDGYPVADTLREHFGAPTLVDNDVNVMALGEARQHDPAEQIVLVKAGTGVGLAYVAQGTVQRGAQGTAGDIGHIRAPADEDVVCRCGKHGCLEAVAGGAAMAGRLTALGIECSGAAEVATLARAGVPEAIALVRSAGYAIGFVLATVVNVLNPSRLVVAGDLTEARDYLFSALRETVYRDSSTLATIELEISPAHAGARTGIIGATTMALEHVLAPSTIAASVASPG